MSACIHEKHRNETESKSNSTVLCFKIFNHLYEDRQVFVCQDEGIITEITFKDPLTELARLKVPEYTQNK